MQILLGLCMYSCSGTWKLQATSQKVTLRYVLILLQLILILDSIFLLNSEQQLFYCSGSFGNTGCKGGNLLLAFSYLAAIGGQVTDSSYPYTASEGICQVNASTPKKQFCQTKPLLSQLIQKIPSRVSWIFSIGRSSSPSGQHSLRHLENSCNHDNSIITHYLYQQILM